MSHLWFLAGLGLLLGFLVYRAGRIWLDTRRRDVSLPFRLSQAIAGSLRPDRYWWGTRINALSEPERQTLLAHETAALGLSRADSQLCPLCSAEVARAWTISPGGQPAVARGPIQCPACDFRLDACRHCTHFSPGDGTASPWSLTDPGSGRCTHHKSVQSVEQACTPYIARRLRDRGYEQLSAPMPIVDSFLPPSSCRSFEPSPKRLQVGGVRWPNARRTALLRLLATPEAAATTAVAGQPAAKGHGR